MDPNANLAEQRQIVRRILHNNYGHADTQDARDDDAQRLAELVQALDEWLLSGGFPPNAWDRLGFRR